MVEQIDLFEATKLEIAESELNEEQESLLKLITINTFNGIKTTQREICERIPGYVWNDNPRVHDHCTKIWNNINFINNHQDKIILSKNFEYKIAETKEEITEYLDSKWNDLSPRLARYWKLLKKVNTDGQYDMFKEKFKEVLL